MMYRPALLVALVLAITPACGGDDDGDNADGGANTDAGAADFDADLPPVCDNLLTMYGDLGSFDGAAISAPIDEDDPTGPQYLTVKVPLNQDAEPDVLFIELWDQSAPFMDGFTTGTFGLVGLQADLFECGTCVYIGADVDGGPVNVHMCLGGTITLDTLDATPGTGSIIGSLTDVNFREVTVDVNGQHTVNGGCETSVDALTFDLTVQQAQ